MASILEQNQAGDALRGAKEAVAKYLTFLNSPRFAPVPPETYQRYFDRTKQSVDRAYSLLSVYLPELESLRFIAEWEECEAQGLAGQRAELVFRAEIGLLEEYIDKLGKDSQAEPHPAAVSTLIQPSRVLDVSRPLAPQDTAQAQLKREAQLKTQLFEVVGFIAAVATIIGTLRSCDSGREYSDYIADYYGIELSHREAVVVAPSKSRNLRQNPVAIGREPHSTNDATTATTTSQLELPATTHSVVIATPTPSPTATKPPRPTPSRMPRPKPDEPDSVRLIPHTLPTRTPSAVVVTPQVARGQDGKLYYIMPTPLPPALNAKILLANRMKREISVAVGWTEIVGDHASEHIQAWTNFKPNETQQVALFHGKNNFYYYVVDKTPGKETLPLQIPLDDEDGFDVRTDKPQTRMKTVDFNHVYYDGENADYLIEIH